MTECNSGTLSFFSQSGRKIVSDFGGGRLRLPPRHRFEMAVKLDTDAGDYYLCNMRTKTQRGAHRPVESRYLGNRSHFHCHYHHLRQLQRYPRLPRRPSA